MFCTEKKPTLGTMKPTEASGMLTKMWQEISQEEKDSWNAKHKELMDEYEKQMTEYKNTAGYKKYSKAISNVNKAPKAKAKKLARAVAKAKAKTTKAAAGKKADSDSDVMGSDSDSDSSSS